LVLHKFAKLNDIKQAIDLLSFNANGLREDRKRRGLFNWFKKFHDAQSKIVLLQETHTDKNNEEQWRTDWGDRNIIFSHGDSGSRGVAILLPSKIDYTLNSQECDPEGRYIIISITIENTLFWIFNCYAPNTSDQPAQLRWLTKIQKVLETVNDSNIILGGDMNDYFKPHLDKFNAKPNTPDSDYIKTWKVICEDSNLCDVWRLLNPNTKRYTWRQGKTINKLKQSRLDYWVISTHMLYDLDSVDIKTGYRSDHSLIDISFFGQKESTRGPSYWRFNANLLRNEEYVTYMNDRIDVIIQKHEHIKNKGTLWDIVKMEI
jgi:exonuclease III